MLTHALAHARRGGRRASARVRRAGGDGGQADASEADLCTAEGTAPTPAVAISAEQVAAVVDSLAASADALAQLRRLNYMHSGSACQPLQALELGLMERLCGLLQPGVDLALALEAAWCVTSIASSGLAEVEAQHVLGASPLLIGHLGNSAPKSSARRPGLSATCCRFRYLSRYPPQWWRGAATHCCV
eukprot:COSAG02_NODE_49_length_45106_cov_298.436177_34_plen_188_part_00